nr:2-oxoglutarate dependent dioxygenase tanshinone IIA synthase [Salvia trijuga]
MAADDRVEELKAFEATKAGVKGLIDAGIQKVPRMFIRPADELVEELNCARSALQVPVIDLGRIGEGGDAREKVVGEVRAASKELGIFQIVNHGVAAEVMDAMLDGVRRFHELDAEVKKLFHPREAMQKVEYASNVDLYRSRAANWRDSLKISLAGSDRIQPEELPEICRDSTIKYLDEVTSLADTLFELLSEALGLEKGCLGALKCGRGRTFVGQYYPVCPEPELTMGMSNHTDPCFLTILLQDEIGGLQALHNNQYINVEPLPGSLVVNIGDMLQIVTNDEFISPIHRVHANRAGTRISVAGFFTGDAISGTIYGPIKELISKNNRARYKEFTVGDYMTKFLERPIENSGLDDFRLQDEDNV